MTVVVLHTEHSWLTLAKPVAHTMRVSPVVTFLDLVGWTVEMYRVLLFLVFILVSGCFQNPAGKPPNLQSLKREYLTREGHAARSVAFAKLATYISLDANAGKRAYSGNDIRAILGPPDYKRTFAGKSSELYLYDRFGNDDWCVVVFYSADGGVTGIGLNAVTGVSLGDYAVVGE